MENVDITVIVEGTFVEVQPPSCLTHLPVDKMAAISQTLISDAFSWMKSFVFWLQFQHWFR